MAFGKEEKRGTVAYKSELLNKYFDSYEELEVAEKAEEERLAAIKKAEEEKQVAIEARKAEAQVVNTAIDAYEEGKVICNAAIKEAYETYKAKVAEAEKALSVLEKAADEELNKFLKAHPETGFHYTYKSKDGNVVRNYNYYSNRYKAFDEFDTFQKLMNNLWNW